MKKTGKLKISMRSIRTEITLLAVFFIVVAILFTTVIGAASVKEMGDANSEQILTLLCETGEKNLDYYFESVEQSVEMLSSFVSTDLKGLEPDQLQTHIERAKEIFRRTAYSTNGVLTYYYRIDPAVSADVKGFWFTNLDGKGFVEREVTDITKYDTSDTTSLVWFTVPKATGEAIWLPPYITDNLNWRVISYNVPIYSKDTFVGVVGIEIDYSTMAKEVRNIKLYKNGYAFINDAEGNLVYHPLIDVTVMSDEDKPKAPEGLIDEGRHVKYTYEGVEKLAVWYELSNGMRLNVTVPVSEINSGWHKLINLNILVSVALLVIFVMLTMRFAGHITEPLRKLTDAAERVDKGDYDVDLDYSGDDEVGILARTFKQLVGNLKTHITDLDSLAHTDALTSVRNKGAYDSYIRDLQQELNTSGDKKPEFAVAIFDCDDLKLINDRYGHDKGDIYLKNTSAVICRVFRHSPVFRIGGDEFAAILRDEDYRNIPSLTGAFEKKCRETCVNSGEWWGQVRVSMGIASYDPKEDQSVYDVARRADRLMYENKHERKVGRGN